MSKAKNKKKFRITKDLVLDILMYAGIFYIIIWSLLKGFGIINTPPILEISPFLISGLTFLIVAFRSGRSFEKNFAKIDRRFLSLEKDMEYIKKDLGEVKVSLNSHLMSHN